MDRPKLRAVDAFPIEVRGETMVALQDPLNLASGTLCVSQGAFLLMRLFDGDRDVGDIQTAVTRAGGQRIPAETIQDLIRQLDENHYLDSPAFDAYRRRLTDDFRDAAVRDAAHAGGAYEEEASALRRQLDGFFDAAGGPSDRAAAPTGADGAANGAVRGLIAPHIDFHRGGPCYAWAYRRLSRAPRPDRFVVFGTCHAPMTRLFGLTRKRYATPFGTSRADTAFVDALTARTGRRYFDDEFAHRNEHSIEFQVIFLQHLFGPEVCVVPILCGSLDWFVSKGRLPTDTLEVQEFFGALRERMEDGARTCVIAGADLSHVGPRFGDKKACSKGFLDLVRRHDLETLARAEAGDAEGLFRSVAEIGDRHRVCGLSPIFTTISVLDGRKGKLLKYDQAVDPNRSQCVSFASLVYPGP